RAYTNLAIVEQACGDLDQAEARAGQCRALYRRLEWPDDMIVVETCNVLGACAAERGHYKLAMNQFREGTALCEKLGRAADPAHSQLLLNLALLHKSQGDLAEALRSCQDAREVYQRYAADDADGLIPFDAAQATLSIALGAIEEAHALTPDIL